MNKSLPNKIAWSCMLLISLLAIDACKSGKGLIGGANSSKSTLEACKKNNLEFTTLSISGRGQADVPSQELDMGMSYRINMHYDSLIWIRVSKLGFEGMRVLVTRDSIFILNRLDKTLTRSGFEPAKKFTGLDANFEMMQDLILGNLYQVPDQLALEKKKANPRIFSGMKADTEFHYHIDTDRNKLTLLEAINELRNQHTAVSYFGFEEKVKQWLPTEGEMKLLAPEEATIKFRHSKVQVDPDKISFKFNIPSGYERIEGK